MRRWYWLVGPILFGCSEQKPETNNGGYATDPPLTNYGSDTGSSSPITGAAASTTDTGGSAHSGDTGSTGPTTPGTWPNGCLAGGGTLVLDQNNNPATGNSYSCGGGSPLNLAQTFTPTTTNLASVLIRVRQGGYFPAIGVATNIDIHDGAVGAPVLVSLQAQVGPAAQDVVFDVVPPIALVPGQQYTIEWLDSGDPTILTWMGLDTDPYPNGDFIGCTGSPTPGYDLNFQTSACTP